MRQAAKPYRFLAVLNLIVLLASPAVSHAAGHAANTNSKDWCRVEPEDIKWQPTALLPPGAQAAILEGDPAKPGVFTMRLKLPDGYRIPSHWHSQQERVTVLSGTLNLGMGKRLDAGIAKTLGPGFYSSMPPGMPHFGWTKGVTILQISSIGPWTVTYVDPRDDPREQPK